MAIAGTLAVNILAKTDKFEKGITRARKSLKGFDKSTKQTSTSLAALSRNLLAVLGPAIIGRMIVRTSQASDELAKMGRRLGFNVEQLQFWQFASKRAGIEQRTLTMAIQRMERRLGEAAVGLGEAQGALNDLNIDAKEFIKLAPHMQFEQIIEATRGITNQNEQLRVFFKLFDSEGVSLVQLLGENVAELRSEFKRLGGAQTKQGLAQATNFVNAMTNLRQVSGSALEKIVIDVSPALTKVIEFLIRERKTPSFDAIDEFIPGTQTRVRKTGSTFKQRFELGERRGPPFKMPQGTILDRPIPPPTARQKFFEQSRDAGVAPEIAEFGRMGREVVSGAMGMQSTSNERELFALGRRLRRIARVTGTMPLGGDPRGLQPATVMGVSGRSRNPFPRTEADKKRIAEKQLKVAEDTLLQNKQQVIEFRKFNNAFINRQAELERFRAAETF